MSSKNDRKRNTIIVTTIAGIVVVVVLAFIFLVPGSQNVLGPKKIYFVPSGTKNGVKMTEAGWINNGTLDESIPIYNKSADTLGYMHVMNHWSKPAILMYKQIDTAIKQLNYSFGVIQNSGTGISVDQNTKIGFIFADNTGKMVFSVLAEQLAPNYGAIQWKFASDNNTKTSLKGWSFSSYIDNFTVAYNNGVVNLTCSTSITSYSPKMNTIYTSNIAISKIIFICIGSTVDMRVYNAMGSYI